MDAITELTKIDYAYLFILIFAILFGAKEIISIFEWFINKIGFETKGMRKRREEHELLMQTAKNLSELQTKHGKDVDNSISHDKRIEESLSKFIEEMRNSVSDTQDTVKQFYENRKSDREQSFKIQKELTDAIKDIAIDSSEKDKQIDNLMVAQREVLADKINQKYKNYISIKGIPEDEVDEFTNLHSAYKALGGNHSGDAKYEYCMNHLQVIPVETKLIIKNEG